MRTWLIAALVVAGCTGSRIRSVTESYQSAMDTRGTHPDWSQRAFADVREASVELLADPEIPGGVRATIASLRIRACVETGDVAGAEETIARHALLQLETPHPGDVAGVALLRAAREPDLDRALAELIEAEERVTGDAMRAFLAMRKVRLLVATPREPKEVAARRLRHAIELCDAHSEGPLAERMGSLRAEAAAALESLPK